MKATLLTATLLGLCGCAASYTESSLPADHPASSAVEDAPPPTRWSTLDLTAADPLEPVGPAMGHADHGAMSAGQSAPESLGAGAGKHQHETPPIPAAGGAAGT